MPDIVDGEGPRLRPLPPRVRVAVVGAGFAGLGMAIRLTQEGIDDFVVLERADDVGGTWRDNSYPGAACDVPSLLYSFSFAPSSDWSRAFSPQPEILAYLRRCVDEFGLGPRIHYRHEVRAARWDDDGLCWRIETSQGPLTADVLVGGMGPLSEPRLPDVPGLDGFEGMVFHSAQWRHDHDLSGERVAVVGTGASAIQFVPKIQPIVGSLHVLQRTPPWIVPDPDRPLSAAERWLYRRAPALQRLVRSGLYWGRESFVLAFTGHRIPAWYARRKAVRNLERQVPDPELRARITPDYRPGCKRLLLSNDYYPAIQQPNVEVVTEKIIEVTPTGVVTADGVEHQVDTILFGTGFHVTDNPVAERLRGTDGRTLAEHWEETGAQAYLGSTVPAFPNLFLLAGPNTGIGHTSLVVMIEAQLAYLVDALHTMDETGARSVEVRRSVFRAWSAEIQRKASRTVWNTGGCASWYLDREGRNTTLWPDHTFRFVRRTRHFDAGSYTLEGGQP
jgi:cation diffusion facilitator CzcD-associated flavoprotein CzcO